MPLFRPLAASLLAIAFGGLAAFASEPLPVIEIEVEVSPGTFTDMVAEPSVPDLIDATLERFMAAASANLPCMSWQRKGAKPGTKPSARVKLLLDRKGYGKSFKIYLFYQASVGDSPTSDLANLGFVIIDPLKEMPRPVGLDRVRDLLTDRIGLEVASDEFKVGMNTHLIQYVPMTSKVEVDSSRLVVPLNAYSLRLASNSPILIKIKGGLLCSQEPEDCEVTLLSIGPMSSGQFKDLLRCRPDGSNCCDSLTWAIASKIPGMRSKQVYLSASHGHCSPFQVECRSDGVSHQMGNSRKGRSSS
jgi:hypothetical protein